MNRKILRQFIIEALTAAERTSLYSNKDNEKELKKAYRKLLSKHHPDLAGDSEEEQLDATETTQEINAIYDELTNKPQMSYEEPAGSSSDGFQWDTNPKMPGDFDDEELKEKIKNANNISGAYGFAELYVEFLRRQSERSARRALDRFNKVNMKDFKNLRDMIELENTIMSFNINLGENKDYKCNFDAVYKSLRALQEAANIISQSGASGLKKALIAYKIGAHYSPLNLTSQGKEEIKRSIDAFEKIVKKMSALKRIKYMWLGASKQEKEEMHDLITSVSSLNSVEGFHYKLYHLILK
tara:strand:- start:1282 stop:2175 length:894 start_codon:yes stop_codon:yes gene_type:complete